MSALTRTPRRAWLPVLCFALRGEPQRARDLRAAPLRRPRRRHPVLVFLSFFWGPMPCMIWAAIIIELAQGILTGDGARSAATAAAAASRARAPRASAT